MIVTTSFWKLKNYKSSQNWEKTKYNKPDEILSAIFFRRYSSQILQTFSSSLWISEKRDSVKYLK